VGAAVVFTDNGVAAGVTNGATKCVPFATGTTLPGVVIQPGGAQVTSC
jgi:hypothetical protein